MTFCALSIAKGMDITMKAIIKHKDGKDGWEIKDVPRKDPQASEVEIQIKAAGICGSELHLYHDNHYYDPGIIIGHEFSGVISRVGSDIEDWKVGDRVVSENHITACGICESCRTGNFAMCTKRIPLGYRMDGGWTNYICLPTKYLIKLPDTVSYEEAAMVEPCAVLTESLCVKEPIHAGEVVLIQGCGTIGLLGAIVAKAVGAGKVIVTGTEQDEKVRLPIARTLGVSRVVNVERENLKEIVDSMTDGKGVDYILEASGVSSAISSSLDLIKRLGRIVAVGEASTEKVPFDWNKAIFKAPTIKFNFGSNYRAWHLAIDLMGSGKIDIKPLITHRLFMNDFKRGFELLDSKEGLKVIMYPFGEEEI